VPKGPDRRETSNPESVDRSVSGVVKQSWGVRLRGVFTASMATEIGNGKPGCQLEVPIKKRTRRAVTGELKDV